MSCSHSFSSCLTSLSTTNYSLSPGLWQGSHFVMWTAHYMLHDFGNCGLYLFSTQGKLLKNKKHLPHDSMHAHLLFPRARLGWERVVECQVPGPMDWPCWERTMMSLGNLQCFAVGIVQTSVVFAVIYFVRLTEKLHKLLGAQSYKQAEKIIRSSKGCIQVGPIKSW